MSKIERLKKSLEKKREKFQDKIEAHFDDVRSANGQPLNDKRCGRSTISRWEKQNNALLNLQKEIERTEKAIQEEESKINFVERVKHELPKEIVELIDNGTIKQWSKYPHIFFVDGVEKARIIWEDKKKRVAHKFTSQIRDREQYKKFANVYNMLAKKLN
ncbi:hypothetical protein [Prevotella intermedia]|uniref:Uncharacterized protein n=1 Tax=Prevotella intermedia TaxID=28131 RepID=A0A2M8TPV8_PREIN|nr:hypothetical protein [Prevotella intermedia]PJI25969.1 hypothetical protein CTM58_13145 [Prevotella intermedia]